MATGHSRKLEKKSKKKHEKTQKKKGGEPPFWAVL